MPQTKTTKKKPTAKVGGGGVGTRTSKFNLKIVIPIVLVVAALGGFYIFRKSGASGNYPWVYGPGNWNISGGEYVNKGPGKDYRLLKIWEPREAKVYITETQFAQSKDICVHYTGGTGYAGLSIVAYAGGYQYLDSGSTASPISGSGNICVGQYAVSRMKQNKVRKPDYITISATGRVGDLVTFDNVYGKW